MLITRGLATALLVTVGYGLDNSNTGNATPITLGFLGDTIITKGYTGSVLPPLPPVENIYYGGGGGRKKIYRHPVPAPKIIDVRPLNLETHDEEAAIIFVLTELVSRGML